jgi:ribose transport system permease protein
LAYVREYAIIAAFVALFIVLSLTSDVFLTQRNLLNLAGQQAPTAILAFAYTWLLISGQFDLSAGAILVIAGLMAAHLHDNLGTWPAMAVGLAVAVACGTLNGWLVAYLRINSFVCTLATGIIIFGVQQALTKGRLIIIEGDPSFSALGKRELIGTRWSIWIMVVCFAVVSWIMTRSTVGRHVFAVGGNPNAARLSGIDVKRMRMLAFVVVGLCAGIAGLIIASRTGTAQQNEGTVHVFAAFAAVVVGGTSLGGGRGAVWRTALGVFFLAMITNAFNLLGIDIYFQELLQGVIILVAVAADALSSAEDG